MESKKLLLGMLVLVLAFGMSVIGCDNDVTDGIDSALNGTWVSDDLESTFSNGNFEQKLKIGGDVVPISKGTYTTNNGEVTFKTTHLWGTLLYLDSYHTETLESRWYTKAELQSYDIDSYDSSRPDTIFPYSINGNTLTLNGGILIRSSSGGNDNGSGTNLTGTWMNTTAGYCIKFTSTTYQLDKGFYSTDSFNVDEEGTYTVSGNTVNMVSYDGGTRTGTLNGNTLNMGYWTVTKQ